MAEGSAAGSGSESTERGSADASTESGGAGSASGERAATFRDVFGLGEFRAMWTAELLSTLGDQVTRVALAVLVFNRTGSAALTGLTYALTFLPLLAGPLLAGLADRYPRKRVLAISDAARAALVALMAIPGLPLGALLPLIVVVQLFAAPHKAARGAILADILPGDSLTVGNSARNVSGQLAQMVGFASGGGIAVLLSPSTALWADAATFAVSALLIGFGLQARPAAAPKQAGQKPVSLAVSTGRALRTIATDRKLRTLAGLAWMIGLSVVPEGIAVPYAAAVGIDKAQVGFLLAADPIGMAFGAFVLAKIAPARRPGLMGPMAAGCGLPLLFCLLRPGIAVSMVLFALCGACAAYLVTTSSLFAQAVPGETRGQMMGLYTSGLLASQGVAIALAGVLAAAIGPAGAITAAGTACLVIGGTATAAWQRSMQPVVVELQGVT